jgi:DTW domain-containing protein
VSRRDNADIRCSRCHLHQPLCICALIPSVATRTRLRLVIHYREARKPTNTGWLAAACMPGSGTTVTGVAGQPAPGFEFADDEQPMLLFPADDAVPLSQFSSQLDATRRPVLVVPDGNWRQASKMRARIQGLATLPCVTLPAGESTQYQLRAEPKCGGLATFEAIARVLCIVEGRHVADEMMKIFTILVHRTLWLRGQLSAQSVLGGIPDEAIMYFRSKSLCDEEPTKANVIE